MVVIEKPVGDLIPYERNAKIHSEDQIDQLAESIRQFGFRNPILIDRNNVIMAGHGRLAAAKQAGLDTVPCICADDMTADEVRKYRLIDNKTAESPWDYSLLTVELEGLDFEGFDLDWDIPTWGDNALERAIKDATENGERDEAYNEFEEKFKPKLTTDDCYTPPLVYDAVKEWAIKEFGWEGRKIMRPFYPGGDYQNEKYPDSCAVIDNPPFSIISEICNFYAENGIDYMLFAPTLTLMGIRGAKSHIACSEQVIYANGANVNTSFVASQGATVRTAPALNRAVRDAVEASKDVVELPSYKYPVNVLTGSRLGDWSRYGIEYAEDNAYFIRALDSQKDEGKAIYGGGYLVPLARAAQAARAARAARESTWELSDREKAIVAELEADNG